MSQELVFTRSSTTKQVSNNKSKNEEKKITQIERPHDSLYRVKQEMLNTKRSSTLFEKSHAVTSVTSPK